MLGICLRGRTQHSTQAKFTLPRLYSTLPYPQSSAGSEYSSTRRGSPHLRGYRGVQGDPMRGSSTLPPTLPPNLKRQPKNLGAVAATVCAAQRTARATQTANARILRILTVRRAH